MAPKKNQNQKITPQTNDQKKTNLRGEISFFDLSSDRSNRRPTWTNSWASKSGLSKKTTSSAARRTLGPFPPLPAFFCRAGVPLFCSLFFFPSGWKMTSSEEKGYRCRDWLVERHFNCKAHPLHLLDYTFLVTILWFQEQKKYLHLLSRCSLFLGASNTF